MTAATAWGDADNDGRLDLGIGNRDGPSYVFRNEGVGPAGTLQLSLSWTSTADLHTNHLAWGDMDGDGLLDLAIAGDESVRLFRNLGSIQGHLTMSETWSADTMTTPTGIAWGDMNGDGALDLAVGSLDGVAVYENTVADGVAVSFIERRLDELNGQDIQAYSLAWSDMDADGDLDLAVGMADSAQVFRNDGYDPVSGKQQFSSVWRTEAVLAVRSIAWGDMDGDGDQDLALGTDSDNLVYANDDGALALNPAWISPDSQKTSSIAWGDVDGDGDLDLAAANETGADVYPNDNGLLTSSLQRIWSVHDKPASSVAWGDADNDGDLDLAVGRGLSLSPAVRQDSSARLPALEKWLQRLFGSQAHNRPGVEMAMKFVTSVAGQTANVVGNATDLVNPERNVIYLNTRQGSEGLPNQAPRVTIAHPIRGGNADHYASGERIIETTIPIVYTLTDPEADPVGQVVGYFSLDGGGSWQEAIPTTDTQVTNLTTSSVFSSSASGTHVFTWDTFASRFFGRSDQVVFRIDAFDRPTLGAQLPSSTFVYTNSLRSVYQRPSASAVTYPFRAQGTQVRVTTDADEPEPIAGAYVYRLPKGQVDGAQLMPSPENPRVTSADGYLPGGGVLAAGDRLVALLPVSSTTSGTLADQYQTYLTSAAPTPTGLSMTVVSGPGVIDLQIPTDTTGTVHPLLVFDLIVATEWDATDDITFLTALEESFKRASELLFDVTNGQVAIGRVDVVPSRALWRKADIQIYATNDMRPSAAIGGFTNHPLSETVLISPVLAALTQFPLTGTTRIEPNAYTRGQVRMGVTWDPFGENTSDLGEQWWRALAHELGHYLLFLPDNYVGMTVDPRNPSAGKRYLGNVDCRGSFMTTTRDPSYDEFLPPQLWSGDCTDTMAAITTGRSDWETLLTFYPMLQMPIVSDKSVQTDGETAQARLRTLDGPSISPVDLTTMVTWNLEDRLVPLATQYFQLRDMAGNRVRHPNARVFLLQSQGTADLTDDLVMPLGSPTGGGDRILVRGAQLGDRLCLYDFSDPARSYIGCNESLTGTDVSLNVATLENQESNRWAPEITVDALTTRTLAISVTQQLIVGEHIALQIHPADLPALGGIAPTATLQTVTLDQHTIVVTLSHPSEDIFVRLWVEGDTQPKREALTHLFVRLPWDQGTTVTEIPDFPAFSVPDLPEALTSYETATGFANKSIGSANKSIGSANKSIGSANKSIGSANKSIGSANKSIGSANKSIGSANKSIGSANKSIGSANKSIGSANKSIGSASTQREFAAPILSPDAQVTIFSQGGLFEPSGIQGIQIVPLAPQLEDEPWLVPVGDTYLIHTEPGNETSGVSERRISLTYLQRDVPEGFEETLTIYFLAEGQQTWERLNTARFVDNRVIADLQAEAGHYSIMSTVELPELEQGWNLMAYPLPDCRTITGTLDSISHTVVLEPRQDPTFLAALDAMLTSTGTETILTEQLTALSPITVRDAPSWSGNNLGLLLKTDTVTLIGQTAPPGWNQYVCPLELGRNECWVYATPENASIARTSHRTNALDLKMSESGAAANQLMYGHVYLVKVAEAGAPYLAPPRRAPNGEFVSSCEQLGDPTN